MYHQSAAARQADFAALVTLRTALLCLCRLFILKVSPHAAFKEYGLYGCVVPVPGDSLRYLPQ